MAGDSTNFQLNWNQVDDEDEEEEYDDEVQEEEAPVKGRGSPMKSQSPSNPATGEEETVEGAEEEGEEELNQEQDIQAPADAKGDEQAEGYGERPPRTYRGGRY